jgi:hypothetical protein
MSEWQIAQALIVTLTSPGPGGRRKTSWITSGLLNSRQTAAFIGGRSLASDRHYRGFPAIA